MGQGFQTVTGTFGIASLAGLRQVKITEALDLVKLCGIISTAATTIIMSSIRSNLSRENGIADTRRGRVGVAGRNVNGWRCVRSSGRLTNGFSMLYDAPYRKGI